MRLPQTRLCPTVYRRGCPLALRPGRHRTRRGLLPSLRCLDGGLQASHVQCSSAGRRARDWRPPHRVAAPGRKRAPIPRTPAQFPASLPRRHQRRARQGPDRLAPAIEPQWHPRCSTAPRHARLANALRENRGLNCAAIRDRRPTGNLLWEGWRRSWSRVRRCLTDRRDILVRHSVRGERHPFQVPGPCDREEPRPETRMAGNSAG